MRRLLHRLMAKKTLSTANDRSRTDPEPPIGKVRAGDLRRITPISSCFGYDRGSPIDRYFIEAFLDRWRGDVHGRALEVRDNAYLRRFGGDRVQTADVLDIDPGNPHATVVADLTQENTALESAAYDCIILTQTMQYLYPLDTAVANLHRALRPGGVLLATLPGITKFGDCYPGMGEGRPYFWGFTRDSALRVFGERFPRERLEVNAHGNVFLAAAFLHGLAQEDVTREELEYVDPLYPINITVRAVKD